MYGVRLAQSIPRSAWLLIGVMAVVRLGFTFILGLDETRLIEPDSNDYLLSAHTSSTTVRVNTPLECTVHSPVSTPGAVND
jgi:hypothetical protein